MTMPSVTGRADKVNGRDMILEGHSKTSGQEFRITCLHFDATSHICVSTTSTFDIFGINNLNG